jgi:hypothetical protein
MTMFYDAIADHIAKQRESIKTMPKTIIPRVSSPSFQTCDQSENERLRAQVGALLAVIAAKDEAFRHAYDILRNEDNSMMTLRVIRESIALKPGDVELVEVGYASEPSMQNLINGNDVIVGKKSDIRTETVYVLKQKEGANVST